MLNRLLDRHSGYYIVMCGYILAYVDALPRVSWRLIARKLIVLAEEKNMRFCRILFLKRGTEGRLALYFDILKGTEEGGISLSCLLLQEIISTRHVELFLKRDSIYAEDE